MEKFKQEIKNIGSNKLAYSIDLNNQKITKSEIVKSWGKAYSEKVANGSLGNGLRPPQYGALSAIRSHWVVSNEPATIVLPTGTGKSETIFSTIVSERIATTLIVVPSNLLREQLFDQVKHLGILPKISVVSDQAIFPNCLLYKSTVKDSEKDILFNGIDNINIIITTPALIKALPNDLFEKIYSNVELVVFDEAHHLAANDWRKVRDKFSGKKILQFTATPFRNDGKKIDGKIIFKYSLSLALQNNYFKPIDFHPIHEYNITKSDEKIADVAVKLLQSNLDKGLNHILLARANSKKRADELFDKIYSNYKIYNPVIIHSDRKKSQNRDSLDLLKSGKSQIVVCVDMFGEGIDIPSLKVAAIHDKYKSLPITLQFMGRFARSGKERLGSAKLITNIASEDLKEDIDELYRRDADWTKLLQIKSDRAIEKEVQIEEFIFQFEKTRASNIDLSQIKMKISSRIYKTDVKEVNINAWKNVLSAEHTTHLINEEKGILIFIEEIENTVNWSYQKDLVEYLYNFFVIFFDEYRGLIHINESDSRKGNDLVEQIFPNSMQIKGDEIYRVLDGINRLMIGTLGLKQIPGGNVSFRMFAGVDVRKGISEATSLGSIKSNLFGHGYRDGNKISVGCSYKGKVWMRWVESLNFWVDWCQKIGAKILDTNIDTSMILENSLTSEVVTEFPDGVPYKITPDSIIETSNSTARAFYIEKEDKLYHFFESDFRNPRLEKGLLIFELWISERKFIFQQHIDKKGFGFLQISGDDLFIKRSNNKILFSQYLKDHSPTISFIQKDGVRVMLEGNLQIVDKPRSKASLSNEMLVPIEWKKYGTNIRKESQGVAKDRASIQYVTINKLINTDELIVFDDDGSGEIADIVTISANEAERKILINLYHCKYSHGDEPGARVSDLYEVCGQAEKSIIWKDNLLDFLDRMIKRESIRISKRQSSRFEKGNINDCRTIKSMIKDGFSTDMRITIVQPGVSISKLSTEMKQLLLSTEYYLSETYNIPLNCYFSE
ncbi:DEAD/DEAH box helicase [Streptococcus suis]|uniref:DEAD/DEAH box helicase n=1 Tax=Streptococcus suis TaxID=1307 RepID=UPI000CF69D10|nr:DEAD/DEAH box helicase family protein [Streptococcus suis]